MPNTAIDFNISESTALLARIIRQKYESSTHGTLKGYLVLDDNRCVISKSERKAFSATANSGFFPCHGSVKCSEINVLTRSLTAMIIAYSVRNNLLEIFRDYPFKKFELEIESYPKYRYYENRLLKYQKTQDELSFLKTDIEW